jgi:hypothetical protein
VNNLSEFPVHVTEFISSFKNTTADVLQDPEAINTLLGFRRSNKRHWQRVLKTLAGHWKTTANELDQLLTDFLTEKKGQEKKKAKKRALMNSYPESSQMNYKWAEDSEGEIMKVPKLTQEMWTDLAPIFKGPDGSQWPVNIRGQLLLWDYESKRPDFLKPETQTLELFSTLYTKHQTVYWEENRAKGFMPRAEFVAGLIKTLPRYDGYSEYPHFPSIPGYFYKVQVQPKAKKTGKLEELVQMFNPATAEDKDKIRALFCTMFWGGQPGERPMIVVTAKAVHGQSSGKTTLIQAASQLISGNSEGYIKFSIESGSLDGEKLKTRVLGANGQRIIFFDNVRSSVLGSGYLEDLITSTDISGHRLHHGLDSIRNYFTVCATLNDSMFSRDIVTRSMIVQILPFNIKENKKAEWKDRLDSLLTTHKHDIITDIMLTLAAPKKELKEYNRFPRWCRDVLSKCSDDPEIVTKNNDLVQEFNAENEEGEKIHEDILCEISRYKIRTLLEDSNGGLALKALDWDEFPKMHVRVSESVFLQWICKSLGFRTSQTRLAKKKMAQLKLPWLKKDKEGVPHRTKVMGARFYTYGNPENKELNAQYMPKIINNDLHLGDFKYTRYLFDLKPKAEDSTTIKQDNPNSSKHNDNTFGDIPFPFSLPQKRQSAVNVKPI